MTSFFKELQSSMSPLYPSKPKFTEKNIGDLSGKVSKPTQSAILNS